MIFAETRLEITPYGVYASWGSIVQFFVLILWLLFIAWSAGRRSRIPSPPAGQGIAAARGTSDQKAAGPFGQAVHPPAESAPPASAPPPSAPPAESARRSYLKNESAASLKNICVNLRVKVGGTKAQMVDRILEREAVLAAGGGAGPLVPPPGQ